jgi:hypothetical protein
MLLLVILALAALEVMSDCFVQMIVLLEAAAVVILFLWKVALM